jgi:hypothetical protein
MSVLCLFVSIFVLIKKKSENLKFLINKASTNDDLTLKKKKKKKKLRMCVVKNDNTWTFLKS